MVRRGSDHLRITGSSVSSSPSPGAFNANTILIQFITTRSSMSTSSAFAKAAKTLTVPSRLPDSI